MSLKDEWGSLLKSFAKLFGFRHLQNNPSIHISTVGWSSILGKTSLLLLLWCPLSRKKKTPPLEQVVMLTMSHISYSIGGLKHYSHQSEGSLKVRTIFRSSLNPHYLAHWTCTKCSWEELYFTKPLCWWRCHSASTGETCSEDLNISHERKHTSYVPGQYNHKRSCGCWDGSSESNRVPRELLKLLRVWVSMVTSWPCPLVKRVAWNSWA